MLTGPFIKVKLSFFVSIAKDLQSFLTEYQTDKPTMAFIYESLESLLNCLLQRFVKPQILHVVGNLDGSQQAKLSLT